MPEHGLARGCRHARDVLQNRVCSQQPPRVPFIQFSVPHTGPSSTPPKILLGIEQEWAARSLESVLAPEGLAVIRAHTGRQTLELAALVAPDLVMVDSRLSDIDGLEVCRQLRSLVGLHVPVVMTTSGPVPRDSILDAHRAGVWGVWEQPFDGEILLLRIWNWIRAKRMVEEVRETSLLDAASGLYSYRGLTLRAREMLADGARRATPTSCVALGAVLRASECPDDGVITPSVELVGEIGRVLARAARASDVVGKLSASEFAILAPQTSSSGAAELAHRVRDALSTVPAIRRDAVARALEIRIGMVTIPEAPEEHLEPSELLLRASTALRFAHSSGAPLFRAFEDVPASFH
jgi:PleD family two-component response regulator